MNNKPVYLPPVIEIPEKVRIKVDTTEKRKIVTKKPETKYESKFISKTETKPVEN